MTVTVMKTYFKKKQPSIISYRDYKKFSNDKFVLELESNLSCYDLDKIKFDHFENLFMNVLDKYAPIKLKYLRANDDPYMNKKLRKEVMSRSKLKISITEIKLRNQKRPSQNTVINVLSSSKKRKKIFIAN